MKLFTVGHIVKNYQEQKHIREGGGIIVKGVNKTF